ncbi:peptide-methionine (S)-S-oxide reductase MsrA [Endothiovibrio diazotrophicus]
MKRLIALLFLLPIFSVSAAETEFATFAGGCFWCVEQAFDEADGVVATTSGYANGHIKNPTYQQVSHGGTGFVESERVEFDPARVSYQQLLDVFWKNHDPTDGGGQFCDHGDQYRPAIFYANDEQRRLAEASKQALIADKPFSGAIVTAIEPLKVFYPAEEYHQDYHEKNPVRYHFYKYTCGRPARLEELWGTK